MSAGVYFWELKKLNNDRKELEELAEDKMPGCMLRLLEVNDKIMKLKRENITLAYPLKEKVDGL